MKLTNQLMLLLGGCVTGSVLLLASIMVSGFHDLTHYHQQQELQAIVTIIEQEFLHNPDAPRVQSWLPPILAANGVMRMCRRLPARPLCRLAGSRLAATCR